MRFWSRLALMAWLLTGLLAAPAMAFGMTCHEAAMTSAETHAAHGHDMHQSAPEPSDKSSQCNLACMAHCVGALSACLDDTGHGMTMPLGRTLFAHFPLIERDGQIPGPPLEPPISLFA